MIARMYRENNVFLNNSSKSLSTKPKQWIRNQMFKIRTKPKMQSTLKSSLIKTSYNSTSTHSTKVNCRLASVVLVLSMLLQMAHTRSTLTFPAAAAAAAIAASPLYAESAISTASIQKLTTENLVDSQVLPMRQKLSIETNSIQRHVVEVNSNLPEHSHSHSRSLKRVFLSNRTITCNDGSQAGFYLRKNPNSKKWIVFLEGGWHCYDMRSCRARWLRLRHLMTSAQWPETRDVGGILSALPDENPYWHNANHVLVPYCSSDSWSGTRAVAETQENNWRFMGALILRQVIADLIPLGLGRATGAELLLVGSSAGGLGVMLNLDRITNFLLHERNLMVTVRGVSDSGWFLDREPYTPAAVASSDAVRQGWKLWQGLLPDSCTKQHSSEPWRCYFGYRLYPTLTSPLFVFQWLFDEAQMRADNVGAPVTPQQWNYIHEMGGALRSSLDNVTAVFAPSCIGHAVLSKRDWVNIKIDDISLPAALRCWEHSTRPRRKRHDKLKRATESTLLANDKRRHRNNQRHQKKHRDGLNKHNSKKTNEHNNPNSSHSNSSKRNRIRLTKEEREERKRRRHERQQRRKENHNRRHHKKPFNIDSKPKDHGNELPNTHNTVPQNGTVQHVHRQKNHHKNNNSSGDFPTGGKSHSSINGKRKRKNQQQKQQHKIEKNESQSAKQLFEQQFQQEQPVLESGTRKQSINSANNKRRNRLPRVPEKCSLRLLERCSWPQCNHSCPTLTNPLTGEEMRFLELLTSFGLDIEAVAAALGVDMHTLNNMDRTELVNLLTQQVS